MHTQFQARDDADTGHTNAAKPIAQTQVIADKRPEAVAQRKVVEMMSNSMGGLQHHALSNAIHDSPRMVAQRHQKNALLDGTFKLQADRATPAEAAPAQRKEEINNTGLPNQLKAGVESLSGMSMDHVTVHYNSDKPAGLQAHAYAQGSEIHLGAGQERHLPHEAWHIVQQAQGRVRPTLQMRAGAVNDDPSLEKEADMMGEKAAHFTGDHHARDLVSEKRASAVTVQRVPGLTATVQLVSDEQVNEAEAACNEDYVPGIKRHSKGWKKKSNATKKRIFEKVAEKQQAWTDTRVHVMEGDATGGFHSINGAAPARQVFGPRSPHNAGRYQVYKQWTKVSGQAANLPRKISTFFPDSWNEEKVRTCVLLSEAGEAHQMQDQRPLEAPGGTFYPSSEHPNPP